MSKREVKVPRSLLELQVPKEVVADTRASPGVGSCAGEATCTVHHFSSVI